MKPDICVLWQMNTTEPHIGASILLTITIRSLQQDKPNSRFQKLKKSLNNFLSAIRNISNNYLERSYL